MTSAHGWRYVFAGFAVILCSLTFATTAPAYFDPSGGTPTASTYDNVIVISIASDYRSPAFDFLRMVNDDRVASNFPAFRPMAIKERASRSAVRPTALSGWRSGRVRTLAA